MAVILQTLEPVRVRGKRYPAGSLIDPPPARAVALVAAGKAQEVALPCPLEGAVFRVRLRAPWVSGRGRKYGALQVVRVGWAELEAHPVAVEVLEVVEDPEGAKLPAEALPGRPPAKLERAAEWLRLEIEAAGGSVKVAEILPRAGRARIRPRTLRRARAEIGAQVFRRSRVTYWRFG